MTTGKKETKFGVDLERARGLAKAKSDDLARLGGDVLADVVDPNRQLSLAAVLIFIGAAGKSAQIPFHVWLPDAHPAAPSHVSAVMSGVMIKTGIYGIIRMYVLLDSHAALFGHFVLIAGIISGILGIVYALGQHDLKRLLAYSSVENIGIILIGIGIGMEFRDRT